MIFAIHWHESAMDLHVFPILNPLPPPSPSHPSGSSQCTSPEHLSHASNLDWQSVSYLIIYMLPLKFFKGTQRRYNEFRREASIPEVGSLEVYLSSSCPEALRSISTSPQEGRPWRRSQLSWVNVWPQFQSYQHNPMANIGRSEAFRLQKLLLMKSGGYLGAETSIPLG